MRRRAGYLFITSPASTTPMHFDVEHSFLLQVRGVKNVSTAAFDEPAIAQREIDRYVDGAGCDFGAMQAVAEQFRLDPGVGVYLPSFVSHWVETEAGVSVSFSIPWYTDYCERADGVYRVNSRLRRSTSRRGRRGSEPVDRAKAVVFHSWLRLREARRKLPA